MRSLDLQLGHKLAWSTAEETGQWRTVIRHRADAAPADVRDLLQREHRRLDGLLAHAVRLLDAGDAVAATPPLLEFTRALMRHLYVEDEVLIPFFGPEAGADAAAVTCGASMCRSRGSSSSLRNAWRRAGPETQPCTAPSCRARLPGTSTARSKTCFPVGAPSSDGAELLERVKGLLAG